MAQLAIGAAGAWVGSFFGPLGASIGWTLGSALGGALFGPKGPDGPRLTDLKLQSAQYGQMIPIVWGRMRGSGVVIDQTDLTEHPHSSSGKGSDGPTTYSYTASYQIALCEGPILGVRRIWADGRLLYDTTGATTVDNTQIPVTFYLGSEAQLPDPTFEAIHGVGNVPGYRGIAYASFADHDLSDFSNRLPNYEFEVFTNGGTIPWRVNTISDPTTTQWWPIGNTGSVYSGDSAIKAYTFTELGAAVYYENNWSSCFDVDVTPTAEAGLGRTPLANVPSGGAPRAVGGGGVCLNYPAIYCYGVGDTDYACWFFGSVESSADSGLAPAPAANVLHGNVGPNGTAAFNSVCGSGVYMNDSIYAPWAHTLGGGFGVAKWAVPAGTFGAWLQLSGVALGASGTSIKFGTSDTGDLFVTYDSGGQDNMLWLDGDTLDILYHWDQSDAAHTLPTGFTTTHGFVVYRNYFASFMGTGAISSRPLDVYHLDTTSHLMTLVGSLDAWGGNISRMFNGFVLGPDGIFSLDPPASGVPLYEIVGGGGNVRGISERWLDATQYNASELTDIVTGYRIADQGTARSAIETLQPAYFFDAVERDVLVDFPKRGGPSVVTIPVDDLAAYEDGQEPPDPRPFTHGHEEDLPRQVSIVYMDEDADFQQGNQFEQRRVGNAQSPYNLQLAIAMTAEKAKNVAHINLVQEHIEVDKYAAQTSRKYAYLGPTDVVTLIDKVVRLSDEDASPTGLWSWKAVLSVPQIYNEIAESAPSDGHTTPTAKTSQDTIAYLLDVPILDDLDAATGYYVAMCGAVDDTWRGGVLYQSKDAGVTYNEVASVGTANVIGTVATALGDFSGGNVVDEVNSITVIIGAGGGELASVTRDGMLNGANYAVLGSSATGWELLQFQRAVLTGTDTYKLTGLRRARRGTEWMMPLHASDETFILLPVTPVTMTLGELSNAYLYKAVTVGQSISDVTAFTFTNTGTGARPYAPADFGGGVNGSGDVELAWHRRTRQSGEWHEFVDVPMTEPVEGYVVEVWNSTYTLCARIIETTTEDATYTAAQQITDFGGAQHDYYLSVGQKGPYQLGRRTLLTLSGTGGSNNAPLSPVTPYNGTTP